MSRPSPPCDEKVFLPPGGEMGELIRSKDWSKTPIGPMEQWPQTLLVNLATILESPFPHLICWGRDLSMLYNDAYLKILGDKPDALGRPMLEVWSEAADFLLPYVQKALKGEASHHQKARFVLQRGGRMEGAWFDFSYSPLRDEQGRVAGILKLAVETTEFEREALAREERFSKIFRATPFLILISTVEDGRLLEVNRAFEEVMGYTREEVLGRRSDDLGLWVDLGEREQLKRLLLEQGRFHNQEMRVRSKNGQERVMLVSGEPIRFGGELCVLGGAQDITELKRSNEALIRSEERFRTLFENSPFGVLMTTPDGAISAANPAVCEMLDMSEQEIRRLGRSGILDSEDPRLVEALEERRRTGRTQNRELTAIRGNGERFPVEVDSVIMPTKPVWSFVIIRDISERKRAEQRQKESEEKFSRVFENAPIPTSLSRASDGVLVDVNRAWEAMFGVPRPEALGKTPAQLGISACPEHRSRLYAELEEKGSIRNLEVTWYRTKENPAPILLANLEVMELGGERYVFTTVQDITERKRAEEAVRESEEKFRAVFEGALEAIYVHDYQGRFLDFNRKAIELLGYSKEELTELTPMELDARTEEIPQRFETLVREGSLSFETTLVHKDGSLMPVEINTQVIHYGEQPAILGVVRDISERKKAEQSLRESEEKFRTVFEGAVESILVHDLNGRLLDINRQTHERLGYTREEMLGMDLWAIDAPEDAERVPERMAMLLREGSLSFESTHLRKDGSRIPVEINAQVLQYGGRPAILSVVRDITQRKRSEEQLRNLAVTLEDRVRERTMELERANRAKNEFLANMSHEIRTPLSGMLGMIELSLLKEGLPGEIHDNLEMILSSALSLNTIINDLLDFSAIEAGRLSIRPVEFSLRGELAKLTAGFEEQAALKGIAFDVSIHETVPDRIVTDPSRVRQILINFLNNALKFTLEGSVSLKVRSPDPDHLSFAVADTGIGIPADRIKDLFKSFTQLDATINKRFGGTGLGLAISRNLAELMGGTIEVRSKEGVGSVFTLLVPVEHPEEGKAERKERSALSAMPSLRILLAEDNPVNQLVIRKLLSRQGHSVTAVADGRQALEELEKAEYDLVLMDIQMPVINGLDATRAIRKGASGRNPVSIPIIALTAYAMKGDREKFLAEGMNGYVTKPVDFGELAQVISEVGGREESND